MGARMAGIGAYVPPRRMPNDELAESLHTSDEWIRCHTGIRNRHVAGDDEATSDLAAQAARVALERAGARADDIDAVLVATASPDYVGFPSTACIVQQMIAATHAAAMDLVVGGAGFVYGLETAKALIASGAARRVLVIGSEVMTRTVDRSDRDTCVLFGDGAGAAVVTHSSNGSGILDSVLKADGSRAGRMVRKVGGSRGPSEPGRIVPRDCLVRMDAGAVHDFGVTAIVDVIDRILERNRLTIDDIAYVVPHQAGRRIIDAAAKRARIPDGKFYVNIDRYGNTVAASIPIALNELHESGKVSAGDLVITVGFGAAITWGGNLLQW